MDPLRRAASVLLAISCALLTSCINGREEIWVNADGSGRAEILYDVPAAAARFKGGPAGIETLVGSLLQGMSPSTHSVETQGDRLQIKAAFSFDSAEKLSSLTASISDQKMPPPIEHLAGKFLLSRSLNSVDFSRTISAGKAIPTVFISPAEFTNRSLTYIFHLPVTPVESTASRTADGGRTLIWERPLAVALREPVVIRFKANFPIPLLIFAAAGAAIAVILGLIVLAIRKARLSASARPK